MEEEIILEAMDSLRGRSIVEWHQGVGGYHCVLDDGRTLIFLGLAIMEAEDSVLH